MEQVAQPTEDKKSSFGFDLSTPEFQSVLKMTAFGAAAAALVQVASIYVKQSTDEVKLDPPTEAVQLDSSLLNLFVQLAEFRHYHENAYRQAVISADDLLLRAHVLSKKKTAACMDDLADAMSFFQNSHRQVGKLVNAATKANPRDGAKVEQLHARIYPRLQEAYSTVQRIVYRS